MTVTLSPYNGETTDSSNRSIASDQWQVAHHSDFLQAPKIVQMEGLGMQIGMVYSGKEEP